ncbi:hypothetical protein [Phocaeicola vulgatus]|uniref:hypothetical protein n=1 Tax=Phocaeicola vulgatus TaxID=821 RepID=UPI0018AC7520|nr:hypothetical protein [Phocaeicola vulgatus]
MTTLNVNATEMVNNSVESNNATMGNVEELTKVLKQEEKELQRLIKRNADEAVIAAQQNVVDKTKAKLEQAQEFEKESNENIGNDFLTFSIVNEETGARVEQQKKIAFVKNNRPVNSRKVDSFIALIAANKYEKAFPIIVVEAAKLIEAGYTVTDIKGRELTKEEAADYLVILDGQHRCTAFAKLVATGKYTETIPNVYVRDIENVGEYLVDINNVGSSWDKKDRLVVASLTTKDELFQNVAELLNEGFNPSTAMLIYTGKSLSDKQVNKALKGEEITFPKGAEINIERGNKFINLCKAAKMDVSFITKRYFIKDFNSYAKSTSEEQAFEALNKLKELNYTEANWKEVKEEDDFIEILKEALEA